MDERVQAVMRRVGRAVLRVSATVVVLYVVVSLGWEIFGSEPEQTCDGPCATSLELNAGLALVMLVMFSFVVVAGYLMWAVIRWGARRLGGGRPTPRDER
jgi:hypothetical protein